MSDNIRKWELSFQNISSAINYTVQQRGNFALLYDYPAVQYWKGTFGCAPLHRWCVRETTSQYSQDWKGTFGQGVSGHAAAVQCWKVMFRRAAWLSAMERFVCPISLPCSVHDWESTTVPHTNSMNEVYTHFEEATSKRAWNHPTLGQSTCPQKLLVAAWVLELSTLPE